MDINKTRTIMAAYRNLAQATGDMNAVRIFDLELEQEYISASSIHPMLHDMKGGLDPALNEWMDSMDFDSTIQAVWDRNG